MNQKKEVLIHLKDDKIRPIQDQYTPSPRPLTNKIEPIKKLFFKLQGKPDLSPVCDKFPLWPSGLHEFLSQPPDD